MAGVTPERLARLLAEDIPDGLFGGPRDQVPAPGTERSTRPPVTPEQAAEHRAALAAALDGHAVGKPMRRHLRVVPAAPHRKAS